MARVRRTTIHDFTKWVSQHEDDVNFIAPVYVHDENGDYEVMPAEAVTDPTTEHDDDPSGDTIVAP